MIELLSGNKRLHVGHPAQTLAGALWVCRHVNVIDSFLQDAAAATGTPVPNVRSQHAQNLAVPPALGHGPVCGFEGSDCLGPFSAPGGALSPYVMGLLLVGLARCGSTLSGLLGRGCVCWGLGGPVVDVPVILVQEEVVLLELGGSHGREVGGGEGREK